MLVIFSDVHLSDESTSRNVRPGAFEGLGDTMADLAAKKKVGATEVHVVLLGDIFDLVRSDHWHRKVNKKDRPWDGQRDPGTGMNADFASVEAQFQAVLAGILATESANSFVTMLGRLPVVGGAKPRVTYVVGNHDRALNNFPSLQQRLKDALPGVDLTFALSVKDDAYWLLARHGHEWDPHCHGWRYARKVLGKSVGRFDPDAYTAIAIGEVVTAEFMSGFVARMRDSLTERSGGALSPSDSDFLEAIKDINNLRPITAALNWIAWFARDRGKSDLELIRVALRDAVKAVLECRVGKEWDTLESDLVFSGDLTDSLAKVLAILKQKSGLSWADAILALVVPAAGIWHGIVSAVHPSSELDELGRGAGDEYQRAIDGGFTDPGGVSADTRFLLYGHTHDALQECFAAPRGGPARMYVNTGTFLPFTAQARNPRQFWTAHRMTYVVAFNAQENAIDQKRPEPTLDVWNGLRWKEYA